MRRFLLYIFILSAFSAAWGQNWPPVEARFDSLAMLCQYSRNRLTPDPRYTAWTDEMRHIADSLQLPVLRWRQLFFESFQCSRYGNHQREVELLDSALAMVDSVAYEYDYHRLLWNRYLPDNWDNYASSYSFIRKELKYYQGVGDDFMIGLMYINLGRIFNEANILEKNIYYHKLGQDILERLGYHGANEHVKVDKIVDLWNLGKVDEARALYEECKTSPWFADDTVAIYGLLTNAVFTGIDPEAVFPAYHLAHAYGKIPALLVGSALNVGNDYMYRGNPRMAIHYFREALSYDLTGDIYQNMIAKGALGGLAAAYEQLGMVDSAFFFQSRKMHLTDSLQALNSQEAFVGDIERYLLIQEEEKFDIERQQARWRLGLIVVVCAALLLLAGAAIWWLHLARRLKAAEAERLATEKMAEQLQRELYQRQCEDNERQLATNTLELMDKKNAIDHINRQIQECAKEGKIDREAQRNMLNFLRTHAAAEDDMQQFYEYFNQLHPNFLTTLKERFPTLTKGELRLCAFIRIGMDNKQIAHVLSINDQSVKKARQRMRKKLQLAETDSLEEFLMLGVAQR